MTSERHSGRVNGVAKGAAALFSEATRPLRLLLLSTLFLHATAAWSGPAMQVTRPFPLPDGGSVELRLWGDEFANGWETLDGYTVLYDRASGWWTYAVRDGSGALVRSERRAGIDEPAGVPHLRPAGRALASRFSAWGIEDRIQPRLSAAPPWATGATNVLVILVQFPADAGDPDGSQPAVNASFTAAQMHANLFGGTSTGPGNMTDYYDEISFGALDLVGTVVGPFPVANDKNDYDDGPSNAATLVAEAIALADAAIDFSPFDNDGDGAVDFVAIAYAGNGPDNGQYDGADPDINDLWPHANNIGAVPVDGGARTVSEYFIAPELLNATPRIRTIGVYAHELGHKLGLPDLYDTDASSQGVGHWCLMGSGSWCSNNPGFENGESPSHMSAWSKSFLGWLTPTDRTDAHMAQAVPQAETNASAVRLLANPGGPDDWPGSGEYFLIENRQRTGFDIGLDGCGLLVWHVDESKDSNADEGHTAGAHRLLDLEEADGSPQDLDVSEATTGNRGDAGDPFPGATNNVQWDGASNPHSDLYNGDPSNQRVRAVTSACAESMIVSLNNLPPSAEAGDDVTVECASHGGTQVMLDGTASSDPDGDALTYSWSAIGVTFDDPASPTPTGTFPLGTTTVTLTVSDGIEEGTDTVQITVEDTIPPIVGCPADATVECSALGGTSRNDPQLAAFFAGAVASDLCDPDPAITDDAPSLLPLGVTTVTFTAEDEGGNTASCTADVHVIDTIPPSLAFSLNPKVLSPANDRLRLVVASVEASDVCSVPAVTLDSIFSNSARSGIADAAFGTPDFLFLLRAQTPGVPTVRSYTVTYSATDSSGNRSTASEKVFAPPRP